MDEIELYLDDAKDEMEKALERLNQELMKIRAGKANPSMLDGIQVEYYGALSPLKNVSGITTPDARSLLIKPFEKNILGDIERAIINSDLGLNPGNDGETIRINIPPLTEERRKQLVKQARNEGENCKIRIRNNRKDANGNLKQLLKEGASEDLIKGSEDDVQKLTDGYIKKVDELLAAKEADIMHI